MTSLQKYKTILWVIEDISTDEIVPLMICFVPLGAIVDAAAQPIQRSLTYNSKNW